MSITYKTNAIKNLYWDFAEVNGWRYGTNGYNRVEAYDGITTRNMGIKPPASAPTFNSNVNGSLTAGNYIFRFTYYNSVSGIESDPSPESASMSALADPNDGIKINIPADANVDSQVDYVRVYRSQVGGQVLYYDGQSAYTGAATTYDSVLADSGLGDVLGELDSTGLEQTFTNAIPYSYRFIEVFASRIWMYGTKKYVTGTISVTNGSSAVVGNGTAFTLGMEGMYLQIAGDTKVYTIQTYNSGTSLTLSENYAGATGSGKAYTIYLPDNILSYSYIDINSNPKPEYFPASHFLFAGEANDTASGLIKCNNRLLVCRTESLFVVTGTDRESFTVLPLNAPSGCVAFRTLVNDEYGNVLFLSKDGVFLTNGDTVKNISHAILNVFNGTGNPPFQINNNRYEDCHAVYDKINKRYYLWVTSSDSTVTNKVLVADFKTPDANGEPSWFIHSIEANSSVMVLESDGKEYPYFADEDGFICKLNVGTNDGAGNTNNTRRGTVTSATINTLTDSTASFYTTGDGYKSVFVTIVEGTGAGQKRKIYSNTSTTLTLTTNWDTIPGTDSVYAIGALNAFWRSKTFVYQWILKIIRWIKVVFKVQASSYNLSIKQYLEDNTTAFQTQSVDMSTSTGYFKRFLSVNKAYKHKIEFGINDVDRPFTVKELEFSVDTRGRE